MTNYLPRLRQSKVDLKLNCVKLITSEICEDVILWSLEPCKESTSRRAFHICKCLSKNEKAQVSNSDSQPHSKVQ